MGQEIIVEGNAVRWGKSISSDSVLKYNLPRRNGGYMHIDRCKDRQTDRKVVLAIEKFGKIDLFIRTDR